MMLHPTMLANVDLVSVSHIFKDLHALSLCHYDNLWTLESGKYCVEAFFHSFGGATRSRQSSGPINKGLRL